MVVVIEVMNWVQHIHVTLIQLYHYCIDFILQSLKQENVKKNVEVKEIVQKQALIYIAQDEEILQKIAFYSYSMIELVVIYAVHEKEINSVKHCNYTEE